MKNFVPFLIGILIFCSCTNSENKKSAATQQDSVTSLVPKPEPLSAKDKKRYHAIAKEFFDSLLLKRKSFNGSILVAKSGNIVYESYNGYADIKDREDTLTEKSAFHLASVSKTFTAMAILKLWQEKKLDLQDDLSKYFDSFPYPGINIKMLLNHRSGLPNYAHYLENNGWDKKNLVSNYDVLQTLYSMHPPLQFTSGKRFAYCNTNYALLALIIEKVSGSNYKTYLENTFFKPLGMNDTYVFTMADTTKMMPSFEWNNRKFGIEFLDAIYGDKNIYSTVRDMLKWDQALYPGHLFPANVLDSAFAPYSFEREGKRNYGLGWRMTLLDNGKKLLYHNGWWHGNNTVFIRLVDEKATIIVLGNRFNRKIYSSKQICDAFGPYGQNKVVDEGETGVGGSR